MEHFPLTRQERKLNVDFHVSTVHMYVCFKGSDYLPLRLLCLIMSTDTIVRPIVSKDITPSNPYLNILPE